MIQTIYLLGDVIGWLGILYLTYAIQKTNKYLDEQISWVKDEFDREIYSIREIGKIERKCEMDAIVSRLISLETRVFDLRDRLSKVEGGLPND